MSKEVLDRILGAGFNRRGFVKAAGATTMGLAAATMLGGKLVSAQDQTTSSNPPDIEILNFALNLEYLEAEFYAMATRGKTLVELGAISESDQTGPTTGGKLVAGLMTSTVAFTAAGLRTDEINHVKFLQTALGSGGSKKPAINLDALGYGFGSIQDFLKLGRQFEDVGVSAYLGAAPLIANKTYLAAAGAILGTEAQHSGALRTECVIWGVDSPAVDSLDVPPTKATPFDVDKNGLSIPRTFSQVLSIVYGGGKSSGGFYPDGVNCAINTVS